MDQDKQSFGLTSRIYVSHLLKAAVSAMFRRDKAELPLHRDRAQPRMDLPMWT